ncbi:MAG: hypothetical protein ACOC9A_01315 [Candidatus Bipolaricaulota bacterium]
MLFVIASMKVELEGVFGLDRSLSHWNQCKFGYTGIGRENVEKAFSEWKFWPEAEGILSVGFVGSIDPDITPGDLCLVDKIQTSGESRQLRSEERFQKQARKAIKGDFHSCNLITLEDTAQGKREKRSLENLDSSIIDRETYWIAKMADGEDIPFLGLRAVFDGIDQNLPPATCYDENSGKVSPLQMFSWLVRNPIRVGELPQLGWNSLKARRGLTNSLNQVIPSLIGD